MAKVNKTDALWREAWTDTSYEGEVALDEKEEALIIRCDDVAEEHGAHAEILDDGRTSGVAIGDHVAFGVAKRKGGAPVAVNVWRTPATKEKKKRKAIEKEVTSSWESWGDSGFFSEGRDKTAVKKLESEWDGYGLPKSCRGELGGIVRNQSTMSGNYFIECAKAWTEYERDPTIRMWDMPRGVVLGDAIVFELDPPPRENLSPICRNIRKAEGEQKEAILAIGFRWQPGKGKGKGKRWADGAGPKGKGRGAVMRMTGILKKKSLNTNRHFIACQDISDVYGKDAQIPADELPESCRVGDKISFDIEEPHNDEAQIMARNVKRLGGAKLSAAQTGREAEAEGEDDEADPAEEDEVDEDKEELKVSARELREAQEQDNLEAEVMKLEAGAGEDEEGEEVFPEIASEDDEDPPPPWKKMTSKSRGTVYYYNTVTGASSEKCPPRPAKRRSAPEAVLEEDDDDDDDYEPPIPWAKMTSKTRGTVYYYNTVTGASSQTRPKGSVKRPRAPETAPPEKRPRTEPMVDEFPDDPTSTEGWMERQDDLFGDLEMIPLPWIRIRSKKSGSVYFYNTDTGASSQDQPQF